MALDLTESAEAPAQTAAALALAAHEILHAHPQRAQALAERALHDARREGDHDSASVALRALGLAALELDDAATAVRYLRDCVDAARRARSAPLLAQSRMNLAVGLLHRGELGAAVRQAGLAKRACGDDGDGRLQLQHAVLCERLGRFDEALEDFRQALVLARRAGDEQTQARVLCDRGVLQTYRGALRAAEVDLREAEELCARLGEHVTAACVRQNLGWLAARRGDLPRALADFDAAEAVLTEAGGMRHGAFELDRCHILLSAGLLREAHASANHAVALLERSGMGAELAEARLALAESALQAGDPAAALAAAEQAQAEFAAQGRAGWVALADHMAVRAGFAAGALDAALHARARRAAAALDGGGWPIAALDARVLAARISLGLGRHRRAARELEAVAGARRGRTGGPVTLRVGAWHAEALLRLAEGRRAGALRALRAGLAVLEAHRLSLGATELRAGAALHGNALAALGLALALQSGRPDAVLAWAERGRAGALWQRPARPPDDAALAADLGELRTVLAAIDESARQAGDTARLLRRQAALERSIRSRARHAAGDAEGAGPVERGGPPAIAGLQRALGARVLVEFVGQGDELWAVVLTSSRRRLVSLGGAADAGRELTALRFALKRLARGSGSAASRAVARSNAEHAAASLDALLLAPALGLAGERELVLVPTGDLHGVPWAALPSCAARAVSVAPSAALWLRAARRRAASASAPGELVFAAGPGLPEAAAEVAALARRHPAARALGPEHARVGAVAAALETARCAHIASHGTFRADNPLFSALGLADGPLTVYDLERLRTAPRDMILSACDGGVTAVRPGDELMGFSAALLALGTCGLVASVVPVPDEPAHRLMLALHDRLAAGTEPAAALAGARAHALRRDDPADYATAAGFVCFGAGSPAAPPARS